MRNRTARLWTRILVLSMLIAVATPVRMQAAEVVPSRLQDGVTLCGQYTYEPVEVLDSYGQAETYWIFVAIGEHAGPIAVAQFAPGTGVCHFGAYCEIRNPRMKGTHRLPNTASGMPIETIIDGADGEAEVASCPDTQPSSSPPTVNFWAERDSLGEGECTTLHWEVWDASVILDGQGVGSLDTRRVCPPSNTTYRLVATRGSERVERNVTITVASSTPPPQVNFSIDRKSVAAGQCAQLRWDVDNVKAIYLDGQGVTGHETRPVCPQATTTYTLRALTDGGDINRSVTLNVDQPLPSASATFWADSASIVQGQCTTLRWNTSAAQSVSLDGRAVAGQGSSPVCPGATTMYGLRAVGAGGIADRSVTVVVNKPTVVDNAQFIADVTIKDNSTIEPGKSFVKTWSVKNTGNTTWTTDYQLVFVRGDRLGIAGSVNVPKSVAPGGTVDISVNMTAPASAGSYSGSWSLRNARGASFGQALWVKIIVPNPAAEGVTDGAMCGRVLPEAQWATACGSRIWGSMQPIVVDCETGMPYVWRQAVVPDSGYYRIHDAKIQTGGGWCNNEYSNLTEELVSWSSPEKVSSSKECGVTACKEATLKGLPDLTVGSFRWEPELELGKPSSLYITIMNRGPKAFDPGSGHYKVRIEFRLREDMQLTYQFNSRRPAAAPYMQPSKLDPIGARWDENNSTVVRISDVVFPTGTAGGAVRVTLIPEGEEADPNNNSHDDHLNVKGWHLLGLTRCLGALLFAVGAGLEKGVTAGSPQSAVDAKLEDFTIELMLKASETSAKAAVICTASKCALPPDFQQALQDTIRNLIAEYTQPEKIMDVVAAIVEMFVKLITGVGKDIPICAVEILDLLPAVVEKVNGTGPLAVPELSISTDGAGGAEYAFADHFGGQSASGWKPLAGLWKIAQGAYSQVDVSATAARSMMVSPDADHYTYEVTAKATGGREGFLVIFKYQGKYVWWNIGGWGNTWSMVEGVDKPEETLTKDTVNSGTWYKVKIAVDGSQATGWLDGVQKWKINRTPAQVSGLPDDGYRATGLTGLVGLGTWNAAAEFDDVKVTVTAAPPVGETPTDANLATNGDFEAPDAGERFTLYGAGSSFGRWTVESGSVDLIGGRYWQAAHGKQSVDLSGNEPGTIFQDLRTKPGQRYILRFAVAGNPEADPQVKRMEVRWGGAVVDQISFDVRGHSNQSMGWLQREYKLLASAQTTRLAFKSLTTGANGPVVDDIQVIPASAAEPLWEPVEGHPNLWHWVGDRSIVISGVRTNDFHLLTLENQDGIELLVDDRQYHILFYGTDNSFSIVIFDSPFADVRLKAEQRLLEILGISKDDACRLEVTVGTVFFANPDYAGKDFPLSFCTG